MEGVKKWLSERTGKKNGIYVHYSPPKVGVISAAQLRQWARGGPDSKLERLVLAGQGHRLLAEAEALPLSHHLPAIVAKCDALHAALEKGSLLELQDLLEADYSRRKYVMCLDEAGVGLLHKAVFYDYMDIAEYLVTQYPQLVHVKDSEGRTPLHYAALCRDEASAAALLEGAGAARGVRDAAGHTPAYYRGPARTLLALPTPDASMARENRNPQGLVIKRHNIRIWCHDCDMPRLQRVVWEGHGARLLSEVSSQPVVRKFLEAVPYIMNTIRDIHTAVVENDLEGLMKHSGDPVPPQALSSRDANYMTVMHKAAGLGHGSILKYIAERFPQGINDIDNDGRTPLHYAAAMRDDQHTFNTLVGLGADESIVDNKNKTAAFYVNRPQDLDKTLFKTLPDAPRTPSSAYPSSWDWKLLDNYMIAELNKKSRRRHLRASNENISSKNNTNTVSESTENRTGTMKASSTHELIKDLPELDEAVKGEPVEEPKENNETKETEDVDENSQHDDTKADAEATGDSLKAVENGEEIEEIAHETTENAEEETANKEDNDKQLTDDPPEYTETINEVANEGANENSVEQEDKDNDDAVQEITSIKSEEEQGEDKNNEQDLEINETDLNENETATNLSETQELNKETPQEDDENDVVETNQTEDENNSHHEEANINDNNGENGQHSVENEGNTHTNDNSEDDDDVHVPGENQSEYSDTNLKSTAEISRMGSANIGSESNGRDTQESIEDIVTGDAEQDSQDASIIQRDESVHGEVLVLDNEIDPEVTDLINTANMEMLATLVLNGEGSRLIGRHSGNSELQSFLDNVASYMEKINMVHIAAREGNIPVMQAALDRRKFAIARDPVSPNGATPMHVATVFGKTNVMKYLGSKFPETLSAVDFEGRTALHYAAVLPDNGHYYNLLQQLGSNSKDLDDNGRSADDYKRNKTLLPFDQLISDFGISEEVAETMFADKGPADPHAGHMDIPMFRTEEGRYLAQSLGDPLIKGLTEVANVKPQDPVAFLATFLHNFPEHEKPHIGTQESSVVIAREAAEVENEQAPPLQAPPLQAVRLARSAARTATKPTKPIDVVTVDPQPAASPDAPETAFSSAKRDEHGQSMLHFAAARSHTRNALFQLLQESDVSIGYRDELYRTARDVSTQANVPENTAEIDRYVLHLAARGNTEKIAELLVEGYDHILDVVDDSGASITNVISERGDVVMINLLASIPAFEEKRDLLHSAVRRGDLAVVEQTLSADGGLKLVCSHNSFSRTALHIAVLAQNEDVVAYLAQQCPDLLKIGDNLERTPLHYAMGVEKIESLSRLLIRAGAKRVLKDLKGRQPSYYFMNKSEILRLQEEEEIY